MAISPQPDAMGNQSNIPCQRDHDVLRDTSAYIYNIKSHQITSDIWHMHVRSIIAVPSMWPFEPGKHRTQDCSLSSPFSFLRSPAVVSPRPKT
ncbi:hypothetical protein TRIATDRAFT_297238 [Trichoderma atroviride IMI 206040]|uniref:Uncharacterized protein n=1 Tax=Hypocrea atroviridis (strain ATCC 20476 / IMI 206040) TaxID=452589 RepID=G9NGS4_HYPAI|nr:uncharacterized protein TRIATDRAFT_297238 [Trichoderma atroviride IMI 206040]EHK50484.1 hypothetical protein TRIATDRAFT_297238 [Trichoderma atroviride IMI 206040]